eukprot:CAMPEP_0175044794 /NCGR_PEP_ID=MMETSP0052_2-20121109/4028_1 /TAXON_ID=51329 ORGANISM="Polytomella parva, Strain SAG 63-3" /NCGR_SAMPLE_ID=MMETSP0052_2 /ASSEMBLY_ACC=CAM_ASM_000194 /LENGTH=309 /DNA_ID=CAMNT_0016308179 /DNA_START=46 /DNA_END=972 /DNA_ORIENTATION=+
MQKDKDVRTIFVRGVSFKASDKDLEETFSDVGPVKQCFLVKDPGSDNHKGFGFVQYALEEDAHKAVSLFDGKDMFGRKLKVEVANKRAPMEERKNKRGKNKGASDILNVSASSSPVEEGGATIPLPSESEVAIPAKESKETVKPVEEIAPVEEGEKGIETEMKKTRKNKRPSSGSPKDSEGKKVDEATLSKHRLMRAVAIGNLSPLALSAALSKAHSCGEIEEILNPMPHDLQVTHKLSSDGCSGHVIMVVYKDQASALQAVTLLHGQKLVLGGGSEAKKKLSRNEARKLRRDKKQQLVEEELAKKRKE